MLTCGHFCYRFRGFASVSPGILTSKYPPRKQYIMAQCEQYLKKPVVLITQIDNLDTKSRIEIKGKLRELGLSLKTPKAHILKKYMKQLNLEQLEDSIVGFIGVICSQKAPGELVSGINYLSSLSKITLLGGKIENTIFTVEGIQDVVQNVPSMEILHATLIQTLQSPSQALVSSVIKAPSSLASILQQRCDSEKDD